MQGTGRRTPNLDISHEGHGVSGRFRVSNTSFGWPSLTSRRLTLRSPSTNTTTTSPCFGARLRSTRAGRHRRCPRPHAVPCDPEQEGGGAVGEGGGSDRSRPRCNGLPGLGSLRTRRGGSGGWSPHRRSRPATAPHPAPLCSDETKRDRLTGSPSTIRVALSPLRAVRLERGRGWGSSDRTDEGRP